MIHAINGARNLESTVFSVFNSRTAPGTTSRRAYPSKQGTSSLGSDGHVARRNALTIGQLR